MDVGSITQISGPENNSKSQSTEAKMSSFVQIQQQLQQHLNISSKSSPKITTKQLLNIIHPPNYYSISPYIIATQLHNIL